MNHLTNVIDRYNQSFISTNCDGDNNRFGNFISCVSIPSKQKISQRSSKRLRSNFETHKAVNKMNHSGASSTLTPNIKKVITCTFCGLPAHRKSNCPTHCELLQKYKSILDIDTFMYYLSCECKAIKVLPPLSALHDIGVMRHCHIIIHCLFLKEDVAEVDQVKIEHVVVNVTTLHKGTAATKDENVLISGENFRSLLYANAALKNRCLVLDDTFRNFYDTSFVKRRVVPNDRLMMITS